MWRQGWLATGLAGDGRGVPGAQWNGGAPRRVERRVERHKRDAGIKRLDLISGAFGFRRFFVLTKEYRRRGHTDRRPYWA